MRILLTAGNTQTPIDDVRVITNVFSGKTGTRIAVAAAERGHTVTLLTSHPELITESSPLVSHQVQAYRTFEDLQQLMAALIPSAGFDAIIHCAAVSDYQLAGTFAPATGTIFNALRGTWEVQPDKADPVNPLPQLNDVSRGKIKSSHSELWLRLIPTPKLIDQIRTPWGFQGTLVKFKLEVGASDAELIETAEASRQHSRADLMVANTHAGMHQYAFIGPINGQYQRIPRADLAVRLLEVLEKMTTKTSR